MKRSFYTLLIFLVLSPALPAQEVFSNHYFSHKVFVELCYDRLIAIEYAIDSTNHKMVERETYMFSTKKQPKGLPQGCTFTKLDVAKIQSEWNYDQTLKNMGDTMVFDGPHIFRKINSDHQVEYEVSVGRHDKHSGWRDSTAFEYDAKGHIDHEVKYDCFAYHKIQPPLISHEAFYQYDSLGQVTEQVDREFHPGDTEPYIQQKKVITYNKQGLPDYIELMKYSGPDTWAASNSVVISYERDRK